MVPLSGSNRSPPTPPNPNPLHCPITANQPRFACACLREIFGVLAKVCEGEILGSYGRYRTGGCGRVLVPTLAIYRKILGSYACYRLQIIEILAGTQQTKYQTRERTTPPPPPTATIIIIFYLPYRLPCAW